MIFTSHVGKDRLIFAVICPIIKIVIIKISHTNSKLIEPAQLFTSIYAPTPTPTLKSSSKQKHGHNGNFGIANFVADQNTGCFVLHGFVRTFDFELQLVLTPKYPIRNQLLNLRISESSQFGKKH